MFGQLLGYPATAGARPDDHRIKYFSRSRVGHLHARHCVTGAHFEAIRAIRELLEGDPAEL
jgi:hypothetical protein